MDGPIEHSVAGGYEHLAIFGRVKKEDKLFRPTKPGPIRVIDPTTGKEVINMPKSMKNAPVEEELDEEEAEETEEEETEEDEPKAKKGGRGNPGNLTPREPVAVPKKVVAGLTPEVQKLLKQREKLLAAGDQKGLRKLRAMLRKAGFRLSQYAGKDDKIANAAKAKVKTKPAAEEEDDD
jgi:hypothetical protein